MNARVDIAREDARKSDGKFDSDLEHRDDMDIADLEARIERANTVLDRDRQRWIESWPGPIETCPPRPPKQ